MTPKIEPSCNASHWTDPAAHATRVYLLCVFLGVLSVLTTCGNLLVVASVVYFRQLHSATNFLILSLAVADLLVGAVLLPFSTLLSVVPCWPLRAPLCRVRGAFDVFLCTSSVISLCFISVDRYYVVCRPLSYGTKISRRVTVTLISASWTAAAALAAVVTVLRRNRGPADAPCNIFQDGKSAVMGVVFMSNVPAAAVTVIYVRILTAALAQARSIRKAKAAKASKTESKATKTLAVVVLTYLVCWCPYFLSMTFYHLVAAAVPVPLIEAFKWLGWSNSAFNPFVYAFFYRWFRSAFKLILSGKIFLSDLSNTKLF